MNDLINFLRYYSWDIEVLLMFIKYLLIGGAAFFIFYFLKRKSFWHLKIQQKNPKHKDILFEIILSLSTLLIYAGVGLGVIYLDRSGYTLIYHDAEKFGWIYLVLSVFIMVVYHDAYFYWTHRLMHHPKIYPWTHKTHHRFTNPTPWSAFSFHPMEAIIEAGILPLIVFTMPVHPLAIVFFLLEMTTVNVLGHLGYEIYPKGFTKHWLFKWINTSTNHNLHHKYFKGNYGSYFTWWDHFMGTTHKDYHSTFDEIKSRTSNYH